MKFPPANIVAIQPRLDGGTDLVVSCPQCGKSHSYNWPGHTPRPIGLKTCPAKHQHIIVGSVPADLRNAS